MSRPRRTDVPGRTSCVACRRLFRHPDDVERHHRDMHPAVEWVRRARPRLSRLGHVGCKLHTKTKVVYATRDDAWREAFAIFARTGMVLTPYVCAGVTYGDARTTRRRPEPHLVFHRYVGCGRWHLSRNISCLPAPARQNGIGESLEETCDGSSHARGLV